MASTPGDIEDPLPPTGREALVDASRRTALAAERTLLAWLRTGLTLTAVAIAVGNVVPGLRDLERTWPYAALGVAYAAFGVAVVMYGLHRAREVDRALRAGRWRGLEDRVLRVIGVATVVLGCATAALIVVDA